MESRHKPVQVLRRTPGGQYSIGANSMAQKDDAQHRHGVFGGGKVGVGAELVGGFPQAGFDLGDVVECVGVQP